LGKDITPEDARTAVKLLKENDIFAHVMLIIGDARTRPQSIKRLTEFANDLDPDFVMFGILTPFPEPRSMRRPSARLDRGSQLVSLRYDPRDHAHREDVDNGGTRATLRMLSELLWPLERKLRGAFSSNSMKRRVFTHMARRSLLAEFRSMVRPASSSNGFEKSAHLLPVESCSGSFYGFGSCLSLSTHTN